MSCDACSVSASTITGEEWPSVLTAHPPTMSRYDFPSSSQTRHPWPRTSTTGVRLATDMYRCDSSSIHLDDINFPLVTRAPAAPAHVARHDPIPAACELGSAARRER